METKRDVYAGNYLTVQIIWLALLISVLVYIVVAFIFINSFQFSAFQTSVKIMFLILAAMSLFLLIPQILFHSFLSDSKLFPRILKIVRTGKPDTAGTLDPSRSILLQNHMNYSIIIWAFGEAPAIFGLTLTFISGDIRYITGFALYSILNLFVFRPSRLRFEDQVGKLRRYLATRG